MQSEAYDLNRFAETQNPKKQMRVVRAQKPAHHFNGELIKNLLLIFAFGFLVVSLLYGQTTLNELTSQLSSSKKEYAEELSEYTYLANEMQMKTNIGNVEQQAAAMGLVKMDKSQITYISLAKDNKIIRPQTVAEKATSQMRNSLMSIMQYVAP